MHSSGIVGLLGQLCDPVDRGFARIRHVMFLHSDY